MSGFSRRPDDAPRVAPTVLCLMGPTAAGKTEAALALAERFPLGLISVDSAMVYRGMDVGTGKPDRATLARVPHRLIDIRDPSLAYSAADFVRDARFAIEEVLAADRVPLLVGGTGLYFRALERGLGELPAANAEVRRRLAGRAAQAGWAALHAELGAVDPDAARRIHPNDRQRIQRALEVFTLTGRPMTELLAAGRPRSPYRFAPMVLAPAERGQLHRAIEGRFDDMLSRGFLDEVAGLRARGDLNPELPAMRAVGYRQAWEHLEGGTDRAAMRSRAIAATRQLARRQLTWLRGECAAHWFPAPSGGRPGEPNRGLGALVSDVAGHLESALSMRS